MSDRIYVITAGSALKSGIADDPRARMLGMQTGCPLAMELVLSMDTPRAREIESEVHKLLADYRVRREWFEMVR